MKLAIKGPRAIGEYERVNEQAKSPKTQASTDFSRNSAISHASTAEATALKEPLLRLKFRGESVGWVADRSTSIVFEKIRFCHHDFFKGGNFRHLSFSQFLTVFPPKSGDRRFRITSTSL